MMNTRRWLSHLAGGLLLALCLLTIVSWAVSYQWAYVLGFVLQNGIGLNVRAQREDLMFQAARVRPRYRPDRTQVIHALHPLPPVPRCVGFEFEYIPGDRGGPQLSIGTPHWFFVLLTGAFPAWHFPRSWRRRHWKPGLCRRCGYDLRGNPAAGRCPECGTPILTGPPALVPSSSVTVED